MLHHLGGCDDLHHHDACDDLHNHIVCTDITIVLEMIFVINDDCDNAGYHYVSCDHLHYGAYDNKHRFLVRMGLKLAILSAALLRGPWVLMEEDPASISGP